MGLSRTGCQSGEFVLECEKSNYIYIVLYWSKTLRRCAVSIEDYLGRVNMAHMVKSGQLRINTNIY